MTLRSALAVGMLLAFAQVGGCQTTTPAIKDYCLNYTRVILTPEERAEVRALSRTVRGRLQSNEVDYLCQCTGWKDPICKRS